MFDRQAGSRQGRLIDRWAAQIGNYRENGRTDADGLEGSYLEDIRWRFNSRPLSHFCFRYSERIESGMVYPFYYILLEIVLVPHVQIDS